MQIKNTTTAYGWLAIALHWISAVGVLWLYFAGIAQEDAPNKAAHIALLQKHISLGACFFIFLLARVIWSWTQPKPAHLAPKGPMTIVATAVQHLLLLNILILIVTGPLSVWFGGWPIHAFDLFTLKPPFPANKQIGEVLENIHKAAHFPILPLVGLHILGAAKSLVISKDRTVQRMLWVKKEG